MIQVKSVLRLAPTVTLLAAACLAASGVTPPPAPEPGGACAFTPIDAERWGMQPFVNPPEVRAQDGALTTTLAVQYTDPARVSIAGCPVTLRSYNGALVGPTLRIRPGDVMNILLDNRLPLETPDELNDQFMQEDTAAFITTAPHPFNTTNLHTHGLHVSPVGNSDNVLLAIEAQTKFPYEIKVPKNHPAGAFWYHAHPHGATAIQVGSGMAGAIIIEDDETRIPAALREANRREKIMVIQTILYDTAGRVNHIAAFFPDDSAQTLPFCQTGNPNCTWQFSHRRTLINGQITPVIRMQPGEVQRWRMIDAAFRESLKLRLEGHALNEIATDGIYTGRVDAWEPDDTLDLEPGYRTDVLVKAGAPGRYRLMDGPSSGAESLRGVAEDENVLAIVVVEGEPLDMALPTDAEMAPLAPFGALDLSTQFDGVQVATFKIGSSGSATDNRNSFHINYAAFNPSRVRYLELGKTEMWSLSTVGDPFPGIPPLPHVFHIHVNPFQVVRTDPNGRPQRVWKDTQLILPGQTINVYTQYLDYIGQFVQHCHILDHEDLGMMEVIEIVTRLPSSTTPAASGHGGHR